MSDKQFKKGKKVMGSVLGSAGAEGIKELTKISPMHGRAVLEYCFGTVWTEPHLSIKINVARQVRGAINQGATRKEIIEAITTCAPYIGYPRTNTSLRTAQKVIDDFKKHPEWKGI